MDRLWIFSFELEISRVAYKEHIKTMKASSFCKELLSENDFEAALVNFCYYDFGANASGAFQKIATDQKDYHKCSSYVVVC